MATKRKPTLSDVQFQGDRARIDPRGFVRPPQERIRPQRYQPAKELLDFRGLSQTITNVAGAIGEYNRKQSKQEDAQQFHQKFAEKNQEAHDDTLSGHDIRFLREPEPLYRVEGEEGNVPEYGQPGFAEGPDMNPPGTEQVREEIGKAGRAQLISPLHIPLLDKTVGRVQGDTAALGLYKQMREDLPAITRGSFVNGKYVPDIDFETRLSERYWQLMELQPSLNPDSPERNWDSIHEFQLQFQRYSRDLALAAQDGQEKDKTQKYAVEVTRQAHAKLDAGMDPTTIYKARNPDYDGDAKAMGRALTELFDQVRLDGYSGDIAKLQVSAIIGKARSIDSEFADNPIEREARLELLMASTEHMRIGTVPAEEHPLFDQVEIEVEKMLRTGGASTEGQSRKWRSVFGESPAFDKARDALRGEDAIGLSVATKEYGAWLDEEAARRNLTPSQRTQFILEGERVWQQQATGFGFENTRLAQSRFAMARIQRRAAMGDVSGAREELHVLFNNGTIKSNERAALIEELGEAEAGHDRLMRNMKFRAMNDGIQESITRFQSFKLPNTITGPVNEQMRQLQADMFTEANRVWSEAEAAGKSGSDAVTASAATGTLKQMRDAQMASVQEIINRRESALSELDQRLLNGHVVSPTDVGAFVEKTGEKGRLKIQEIEATTGDNNLFYKDPVTSPEWQAIHKELQDKVHSIASIMGDPADPYFNTAKKVLADRVIKQIEEAGREVNAAQRGKSSPNWKAEIMGAWRTKMQEVVDAMPETFKQSDMDDTLGLALTAGHDVASRFRSVGVTRSTFENSVKSWFNGLTSGDLLTPLARDSMDAREFVAYQSSKVYGSGVTSLSKSRIVSKAIQAIRDASPDTHSPTSKAQAAYDVLLIHNKMRMSFLEDDTLDLGALGMWPGAFGTVSVSDLNLKAGMGPLFESVDKLEAFTSDGDRFSKVSERLGFGKWDPEQNPDSDPRVQKWKTIQAELIRRIK